MSNTITINVDVCSPAPAEGYKVYYRAIGSPAATAYQVAGPFFTSPFVIIDDFYADGTKYEGYIVADCGETEGPPVYWNNGDVCGFTISGSYAPLDLHDYGNFYINTSGVSVLTILYNCYDRPNKFIIHNVTDATVEFDSDWVGFASYAGPWGASLSTPLIDDFDVAILPGKTYALQVFTGNAESLSDLFDAQILCDV
jgi:hypothetical protein